MKVFLAYGYDNYTTGIYFERALAACHEVVYIGPPSLGRSGYRPNEDISRLVQSALLPKPDLVLFVDSPGQAFPVGLERLECPTACYLIDVHQGLHVRMSYAPFFDYVFSAQKDYVGRFVEGGQSQSHWLPLACDPVIHGSLHLSRCLDVGFVGNLGASAERERLLSLLATRFKMNDYRRRYAKEDISTIYSQARTVVNVAVNGDLNMRVFEAMAAGALLVTDRITNGLEELFTDGKHLILFQGETDLLDKLQRYLADNVARASIAAAGRNLVLKEHTYSSRIDEMLRIIFSSGGPVFSAPARKMDAIELRAAYGRIFCNFRLVDPAMDLFAAAWSDRSARCQTVWMVMTALLRRLNSVTGTTAKLRETLGRLKMMLSRRR
jgi:hypothetical protein